MSTGNRLTGVYVEISGDYSRLQADLRQANQIVRSSAKGMSDALGNALSPQAVQRQTSAMLRDLNTLKNGLALTGRAFDTVSLDVQEFGHVTGLSQEKLAALHRQMLQTRAQQAQEQAFARLSASMGLTATQSAVLKLRLGDVGGGLQSLATIAQGRAAAGFSSLNAAVFSLQGALLALGVGGAVRKALGEFSDFDKAMVAVAKTTDMAGPELEAMAEDIRALSLAPGVGAGADELANLAATAGQLGVKGRASLLEFAKTVAQLGLATNLSGEEAATALARILNVTGEGADKVGVLGSVIVELGNNMATTESEIAAMATQVAQATAVFGVSSTQAAALGATMRSLGVQSELGGSVVGRAMRAMDEAVRGGGQSLKTLSQLTGQTGDQFRQTFRQDATDAFRLFVEGLGRVVEGGGDVTRVLEALGLQGEEVLKVLPTMATRADLLGYSLKLSGEEQKRNTALTKEATAASASFAAQMDLAGRYVDSVAADLGKAMAPAIVEVAEEFRAWADANADLLRQDLPAYVHGLADGVAGAAESFGSLAGALAKIVDTFNSLPPEFRNAVLYGGGTLAVTRNLQAGGIGALYGLLKGWEPRAVDQGLMPEESRKIITFGSRPAKNTYRAKVSGTAVDPLADLDKGIDAELWGGSIPGGSAGKGLAVNLGASAEEAKNLDSTLEQIRDRLAEISLTDEALAQYKIQDQYDQWVKVLGAGNPELQAWVARERELLAIRQRSAELAPAAIAEGQALIDAGGDSILGRVAARDRGKNMAAGAEQENLQLQTEFAEKYKAVVLGETQYKISQIEAAADAYRRAGADEVAVAQWAAQEKLAVSRDWEAGAERALKEYADAATDAGRNVETALSSALSSSEDALVEFVTTGKASFSDLADSILADMARLAIRQSITGPLSGWLGSLFGGGTAVAANALGGIYSGAGISAYSGRVVDRPTIFPFAKGVGLMGEAGPEAILPVKRNARGELGVQSEGNGKAGMTVNIHESPGTRAEVQQNDDGQTLEVLVRQVETGLSRRMATGQGLHKTLGSLYGARRRF